MKVLDERDAAHVGSKTAAFRTEDIANSAEYRRAYEYAASVISPEEQPFEQSPDGIIYDSGDDGGPFAEAALQTSGDVVLSAAFPGPEVPGRMNSLVARVEANHDFPQRDDIIFALRRRFEFD